MGPSKVQRAELTRESIVARIREAMSDHNRRNLQQATLKVYNDLVDAGYQGDLADMFACEGMENTYRRSLSQGRQSGDVAPKPAEIIGGPHFEDAGLSEPGNAAGSGAKPPIEWPSQRPPNRPFDPGAATGLGDRIILELPALVGRLATEYWVADGRYKALGLLTAAEVDMAIQRSESRAEAHQQSARFLRRVRAGMGRNHATVLDAFPDPKVLDELYKLSMAPAKP